MAKPRKRKQPARRREQYPSADAVRALDHLDVAAAAAQLGVRPSYVARIRSRGDRPGAPRTSTVLRLNLPLDLHDRVRQYAASLISAGE